MKNTEGVERRKQTNFVVSNTPPPHCFRRDDAAGSQLICVLNGVETMSSVYALCTLIVAARPTDITGVCPSR